MKPVNPVIGTQHSRCPRLFIQVLLETAEGFDDLHGIAEFGYGVGDGVMIPEPQQRQRLLRIQLLEA